MMILYVAAGAAVGAPMRYLTDRTVQRAHPTLFPWGTLTVNVVGSLLLGLLAGLGANTTMMTLVGTGFCGSLTTYSTFGYETIRLAEVHHWSYSLGNVVLALGAGVAAAAFGFDVGRHW